MNAGWPAPTVPALAHVKPACGRKIRVEPAKAGGCCGHGHAEDQCPLCGGRPSLQIHAQNEPEAPYAGENAPQQVVGKRDGENR
jgi:hypothetical protein